MEELDRLGMRTKTNGRGNGPNRGGIRFGVGSLAHLLKNRFYIGEVVYRGESHRGEHEPILDRELFEAVQVKRAAGVVARNLRLNGSPAILTGRIFDDRGNRMTPTHANKLGVRYRYYVSHVLIQKRKAEAGSVARLPAPEIEAVVLDAVRKHIALLPQEPTAISDRDLIERYVERVVVMPEVVELYLLLPREVSAPGKETDLSDADTEPATTKLALPWTIASFAAVKGIVHAPGGTPAMKGASRDALLTAIAKARTWVEGIQQGRVASFADIAQHEGQVERHIRLLAPLAFVSPRIIAAIVDGTAPADLTVTGLAKALPYSWAEQEQDVGQTRGRPQT